MACYWKIKIEPDIVKHLDIINGYVHSFMSYKD